MREVARTTTKNLQEQAHRSCRNKHKAVAGINTKCKERHIKTWP
jgi:hypothetical protein